MIRSSAPGADRAVAVGSRAWVRIDLRPRSAPSHRADPRPERQPGCHRCRRLPVRGPAATAWCQHRRRWNRGRRSEPPWTAGDRHWVAVRRHRKHRPQRLHHGERPLHEPRGGLRSLALDHREEPAQRAGRCSSRSWTGRARTAGTHRAARMPFPSGSIQRLQPRGDRVEQQGGLGGQAAYRARHRLPPALIGHRLAASRGTPSSVNAAGHRAGSGRKSIRRSSPTSSAPVAEQRRSTDGSAILRRSEPSVTTRSSPDRASSTSARSTLGSGRPADTRLRRPRPPSPELDALVASGSTPTEDRWANAVKSRIADRLGRRHRDPVDRCAPERLPDVVQHLPLGGPP